VGGGKADAYARFVVGTVKPAIDTRYRTLPGKADTAVMGSSFGGLISLYLAQRYPDVFGHAGIVSGSFWWNGGALVASAPQRKAVPVQLYVDGGTGMDGIEGTRDFRKALLARGWQEGRDLLYVEDEGGLHNERDWAGRVHRALAWIFPAQRKAGNSTQ
jgi:predicted alpha/beta superfamily hydrolase